MTQELLGFFKGTVSAFQVTWGSTGQNGCSFQDAGPQVGEQMERSQRVDHSR